MYFFDVSIFPAQKTGYGMNVIVYWVFKKTPSSCWKAIKRENGRCEKDGRYQKLVICYSVLLIFNGSMATS